MNPRRVLSLLLLSAAVPATGCHRTPDEIWVPGEDYRQELFIEAAAMEVRAGEWLELDAERHTGPWVPVPRPDELPEGNCWWRRPPSAVESHVGANVRWFAQPQGEFNLPTPADGFRRRVRFDRQGTYTLRAQSAGCPGPYDSETLTVRVLP